MLKLSVITPTLNQGKFIERAIRSVLDQGYENLEFMIVDGGSTDETLEIIKRYEDRLTWWVSEPDEGQTHAIGKGLARATGDVIAYLNSDDYYLPGAFEKAIAALQGSDAAWVAGAALNVDAEGRKGAWRSGDEWHPTLPHEIEQPPHGRHWWVARNWSVPQPATFWRREIFERHGGFRRDMHFAFDVEFMERLALAGEMPLLLRDEFLAARVLHPDAKSSEEERWEPEYRLLRRALSHSLTIRERALLPWALIADPFAAWRQRARLRLKRTHLSLRRRRDAVIRAAGNLLDRVPEQIRPKIRTRDRKGPRS